MQLADLNLDLQELTAALDRVEADAAASAEEKQQLRREYERKIDGVVKQMAGLQQQMKQQVRVAGLGYRTHTDLQEPDSSCSCMLIDSAGCSTAHDLALLAHLLADWLAHLPCLLVCRTAPAWKRSASAQQAECSSCSPSSAPCVRTRTACGSACRSGSQHRRRTLQPKPASWPH